MWDANPEPRQLPSLVEWLVIRLLTRQEQWNTREARLMSVAGRHLGIRMLGCGVALVVGLVAAAAGFSVFRAKSLLDRLFEAEIARVPVIVQQMAPFRSWIDPRLQVVRAQSRPDSQRALSASLALLPDDANQVDYLAGRLLDADPATVGVIRSACARAGTPHRTVLAAAGGWGSPQEPADPSRGGAGRV